MRLLIATLALGFVPALFGCASPPPGEPLALWCGAHETALSCLPVTSADIRLAEMAHLAQERAEAEAKAKAEAKRLGVPLAQNTQANPGEPAWGSEAQQKAAAALKKKDEADYADWVKKQTEARINAAKDAGVTDAECQAFPRSSLLSVLNGKNLDYLGHPVIWRQVTGVAHTPPQPGVLSIVITSEQIGPRCTGWVIADTTDGTNLQVTTPVSFILSPDGSSIRWFRFSAF